MRYKDRHLGGNSCFFKLFFAIHHKMSIFVNQNWKQPGCSKGVFSHSKNMNKKLSLLFIALSIVFATNANPVSKQDAKEIGHRFLKTNDLHLAKTYNLKKGNSAFYVFTNANGFVIVSADDRAMPILAYSNEGGFNESDIPEQMQYYLDRFVAQIQYGIENQIVANEFTARQWKNVRETGCLNEQRNTTVVAPLLTSRWNQNYPYNRLCPSAPGGPGNHAYAGCVATAMGQIMRFWGYPETGQGSHGGVNFGSTTYQWNQMQDAIPSDPDISEIRPIATLLWHCGVAVDMQYSASGSGADVADVPNALVAYFKYASDMQHEYKDCQGDVFYNDSQWIEKIKNCLNIGRPILYGAADDNIGMGHAFVCDGYDGNDMLHFNWGWSGTGNAYYSLGALNVTSATGYNYYFNTCNSAIFNIHPINSTAYFDITATANPAESGTITGNGTFEEGQTCTLTASANDGYIFANWTKNGEVVSNSETYSFTVTENAAFVANFEINTVTRAIALSDGWNWVSFNVDITLADLKAALVTALGNTTIQIKSKDKSTTYNGDSWRGSLNSLDVSQMCKIKTTDDCVITLTGIRIMPESYPVIINHGVNWIGFPLNESISISDAFDGFAVNGDLIKSKDRSSSYNGSTWRGTLNTLEFGKGYIYKSIADEQKVFYFPH